MRLAAAARLLSHRPEASPGLVLRSFPFPAFLIFLFKKTPPPAPLASDLGRLDALVTARLLQLAPAPAGRRPRPRAEQLPRVAGPLSSDPSVLTDSSATSADAGENPGNGRAGAAGQAGGWAEALGASPGAAPRRVCVWGPRQDSGAQAPRERREPLCPRRNRFSW